MEVESWEGFLGGLHLTESLRERRSWAQGVKCNELTYRVDKVDVAQETERN